MLLGTLAFFLHLLGATFAYVSAQVSEGVLHCSGILPQQSMDLDQVLGMWYAVEVVHHYDGPKSNHVIGRTVVDTCPVLHLSRYDEHRLRLLWTESAGVIEYNFNLHDLKKPGFWITLGAQNGSLPTSKRYRQFAGTVEVTKAVNSHMVLTFCTPGTELYSVVMSREKWLAEDELMGVNKMLEHRGLPRIAVKEACRGSAENLVPNIALLLVIISHLYKHFT